MQLPNSRVTAIWILIDLADGSSSDRYRSRIFGCGQFEVVCNLVEFAPKRFFNALDFIR